MGTRTVIDTLYVSSFTKRQLRCYEMFVRREGAIKDDVLKSSLKPFVRIVILSMRIPTYNIHFL